MGRVKRLLQGALGVLGLHQRLKSSILYDVYWRFAGPEVLSHRDNELRFYRHLLAGMKPGALIFDVGANHGFKADVFVRLGARVVAIEPDSVNLNTLRQRFHTWRVRPKSVSIVPKAVGARVEELQMWLDAPGSAKNTLSAKWVDTLRTDATRFGETLSFAQTRSVQTTTLDQLIVEYGQPFYIKIDVEGYEAEALRGLTSAVPFLSFEVNLPHFETEGLECIRALCRLSATGRFNYAVSCERGLDSALWIDGNAMGAVLRACPANSLEVFWQP